MNISEVQLRLGRIYAALGDVLEKDPESIRPVIETSPAGRWALVINFGQGTTPASLQNLAYGMIDTIAGTRNHFRRYAGVCCPDIDVEEALRNATGLSLMADLSDTEKHGGGTRAGRRSLHLSDLRRVLEVTSSDGSSGAGIMISPSGIRSEGGASVVLFAEILDDAGQLVGLLPNILRQAMTEAEHIAEMLGIPLPPN